MATKTALAGAKKALNECITPEHQAYIDSKIQRAKDVWYYDYMDKHGQADFNNRLKHVVDFQNQMDAAAKAESGYYDMSDEDRKVFDKM